jgi:hypothetical protein
MYPRIMAAIQRAAKTIAAKSAAGATGAGEVANA